MKLEEKNRQEGKRTKINKLRKFRLKVKINLNNWAYHPEKGPNLIWFDLHSELH